MKARCVAIAFSPLVPGQQYDYLSGTIGNRTNTKAGGDSAGANLRTATYTPNLLNQYTSRTIPSACDGMGLADATATISINGSSAGVYRNLLGNIVVGFFHFDRSGIVRFDRFWSFVRGRTLVVRSYGPFFVVLHVGG